MRRKRGIVETIDVLYDWRDQLVDWYYHRVHGRLPRWK